MSWRPSLLHCFLYSQLLACVVTFLTWSPSLTFGKRIWSSHVRLSGSPSKSLPKGFEFNPEAHDRPKVASPVSVSKLSDLHAKIARGYRVRDLDVRGNVSDTHYETHPVLQAIYERKRRLAAGLDVSDGRKIALAIEGGGMRGCVTAGMASVSHIGNVKVVV